MNIPIWWYAVLAMSSGFNHAIVEGLPSASDFRTYEQQARLATIADPRLRQEVSDFFSECYVPARSKFQAERPDTSAVGGMLATYGKDDPDWMGSHVYRNTAGYFDTLRPTKQIPGWAYNPIRDTEYDPSMPPLWGKPTCKEWWEEGTSGLREKLIDEADATSAGFSSLVVAVAPILASEQQKDAVARTILSNAPPSWSNNDLVASNTATTGWIGTAENIVKGGLATGGVITASALFSVTMTVVLQALPLVQALLLLGIYALLPMIVVLSRYSLSMMVVGAMAIFTVKFWSVLWYLAMWVDQNLIQSMYPDVNVFLQIFANPGEHDVKRMLLNMITTSLYLGLPLLWSGMMLWAGVKVGRSITSATISKRDASPRRTSRKDRSQHLVDWYDGCIRRQGRSREFVGRLALPRWALRQMLREIHPKRSDTPPRRHAPL